MSWRSCWAHSPPTQRRLCGAPGGGHAACHALRVACPPNAAEAGLGPAVPRLHADPCCCCCCCPPNGCRPGCTHLTADLFLGAEGAAAATAVTAQQLAAGLRRAALGSAADSPIVVQWHGQVAASCSSAAGVVRVPAAEPRLLASPACVVAHADEQPQQLLQLQLLPSGAAGSDGHAVLPAAGIVLCRQAGRQVPVEVWGVSAAAAHAALAEAAAAADDGPADSGSDSEAEQVDEQQPAVAQHADLSMGGQQDTLWVRPVGLRAGCCELEVQLPLACPLGGEYGGRGVLLSSAAPLLVLRDAAAAREVQALLECSGQPGEARAAGCTLQCTGACSPACNALRPGD